MRTNLMVNLGVCTCLRVRCDGELRVRVSWVEGVTHPHPHPYHRSYHNLTNEGYFHHMVNHSEDFVDANIGVHTQNVDRLWRDVKSWILRSGIKKTIYSKYIARHLHSRAYKGNASFHHLLQLIADTYKHPNSP